MFKAFITSAIEAPDLNISIRSSMLIPFACARQASLAIVCSMGEIPALLETVSSAEELKKAPRE